MADTDLSWVVKTDYFLVLEPGDDEPHGAAVAWDKDGGCLFLAYQNGQWVDDPALADVFVGGNGQIAAATQQQAESATPAPV